MVKTKTKNQKTFLSINKKFVAHPDVDVIFIRKTTKDTAPLNKFSLPKWSSSSTFIFGCLPSLCTFYFNEPQERRKQQGKKIVRKNFKIKCVSCKSLKMKNHFTAKHPKQLTKHFIHIPI